MGAIQAAEDLYGDCSFPVIQTRNAWYAVGVGPISPVMDLALIGDIGLPPFKCGVTDPELISLKMIFTDCDSILHEGTKIPVFFQVDGGVEIWDTIETTTQYQFGDTLVYTFSTPVAELSVPGKFTLQAGVQFPIDNTPGNDTKTIEVERVFYQNVDVGVASIQRPLPSCFLETEPITVEIGFYGCDSIAAGQNIDVFYQLNGSPIISESVSLPTTLLRGETYLHTFDEQTDLSEIKNHQIDVWATYQPDTLPANDSLLGHFVVKPVRLTNKEVITFEAGQLSKDSIFHISASQSRAFISEASARIGEFGFQITGGDFFSEFAKGNVDINFSGDIWEKNPQFHSKVCLCADLTNFENARLKFFLKQTHSPLYEEELMDKLKKASAARVTVENEQIGTDYFPVTTVNSPYFSRSQSLDDYVGKVVEICIETMTLMDKDLDPYGVGDNVYIDNLTIEGTTFVNTEETVLSAEDVVVFPNPGNGQFKINLDSPSAINADLAVLDVLGKNIFTKQLTLFVGANQCELNLPDTAPGIYFIQLTYEGKKVVKEVVIF